MKDRWVILTQPNCTPCKEAKQMLWDREIPYAEFDITLHHDLKSFLVQSLHKPTTPQVFLNGYRIGGRDELREYFRNLENTD